MDAPTRTQTEPSGSGFISNVLRRSYSVCEMPFVSGLGTILAYPREFCIFAHGEVLCSIKEDGHTGDVWIPCIAREGKCFVQQIREGTYDTSRCNGRVMTRNWCWQDLQSQSWWRPSQPQAGNLNPHVSYPWRSQQTRQSTISDLALCQFQM